MLMCDGAASWLPSPHAAALFLTDQAACARPSRPHTYIHTHVQFSIIDQIGHNRNELIQIESTWQRLLFDPTHK